MLLFKYFEKRAKDGLPNPNGPYLHVYPHTKALANRGYLEARGVSAEWAASEGKKCDP